MLSFTSLKNFLRNPVSSLFDFRPLSKRLRKHLGTFVVNSGNWSRYPNLSLQAANDFPIQLAKFLKLNHGSLLDFDTTFPVTRESVELGQLFMKHGSDKHTHGYERIYSKLFSQFQGEEFKLLEIGIGTNSPRLISSMGRGGFPGASLRAFSEFYQGALVYGADIDDSILFDDGNIRCGFLDQNNLQSYFDFYDRISKNKLDVVIDDGLHSTKANLNTIFFAINNLSSDGIAVIEDISDSTLPVWHVVLSLLEQMGHKVFLTRAIRCNVFIYIKS